MMVEWLVAWADTHSTLLWWLAAASVLMFVGSLIVVPWVVVRIPHDYFAHSRRPERPRQQWPLLLRLAYALLKNVVGAVLIAAGIAMLVLPGQGLITLFIGLMLLDFPGKFRLERRIVSYSSVLRAMNWLRARRGVPPLRL
ncbi:PGPGW domain-containing protein [Algiphilus sp.]|uniref:PGPGW domain-containing protein n=1 Tax=Algiphilus sp. TaxID=1872431 RepID=UPI003B51ED47